VIVADAIQKHPGDCHFVHCGKSILQAIKKVLPASGMTATGLFMTFKVMCGGRLFPLSAA
jgi:hypothetical protein